MKQEQQEHILSYLEQQRAEKLAEMGGYLRHLREEQALSLEEVAAKTKVQARLLHAIEEGRLEPLPEPVYIKGFIQRYADALGLNGAEFASVFPTAVGFQNKRSWRNWYTPQLKPVHLYLFYIFLVIGAVTGLSSLIERSPAPVSNVAGGRLSVAKSAAPRTSPKADKSKSEGVEVASTAATAPVAKPGEAVRVDIEVKEESWVRVKVDGKTKYQGLLKKGEKRTWTAKQELVVRSGNAGGVILAFNQEEAKPMGDLGQPKTLTFKSIGR
ncbi:helix-turn-helix domain-containing protein [Microseira wollei]|uniref:Transcriptional regulator, XRE family protein n=1 Tax=Microseira wollei NIES-4236 TaxID=2530354 RepID=A0AAV3X859_9CYAN|nr:RodZ domain-containing protein [Microseira wollei]GET36250.1 transcriptional regulator, XRE family protein [Microseira wollei NIES-4236]